MCSTYQHGSQVRAKSQVLDLQCLPKSCQGTWVGGVNKSCSLRRDLLPKIEPYHQKLEGTQIFLHVLQGIGRPSEHDLRRKYGVRHEDHDLYEGVFESQ